MVLTERKIQKLKKTFKIKECFVQLNRVQTQNTGKLCEVFFMENAYGFFVEMKFYSIHHVILNFVDQRYSSGVVKANQSINHTFGENDAGKIIELFFIVKISLAFVLVIIIISV